MCFRALHATSNSLEFIFSENVVMFLSFLSHHTYSHTTVLFQRRIEGGRLGGWPPPSLGSFKLEIKRRNKTITGVILSLIVPLSFCLVSYFSFKNPGTATVCNIPNLSIGIVSLF